MTVNPVLFGQWYTDPFCSWSFAAEKAIQAFQDHFGDRLRLEHRLFVLYRDLDLFLRNHHLEHPRDFAPKIQKVAQATGVPMTAKGWESGQVPQTTETCCLFVKAAQIIDPALGERFLRKLRVLAFQEGKNIGDKSVLLSAAQDVGIKKDLLESTLASSATAEALGRDNEMARSEGVTVRPTLILANSGGDRVFIGGLRNSDLFILAGEVLIQESA
jgi:predicted DsbA family dithiol-disulfide isomerase